ncbi:expressed unknown protein [Seminavis robusta]|uniref:Uncharacterized protein n=1 Tax=Seminavis robusta TaxID=568900 RepID=A0A9N8EK69_9STRA|nr:expressed unknown protein [Seminavis robusta]|eukprot:Sro1242_g255480.1 n/a (107) ;mRNA; f:7083-7403
MAFPRRSTGTAAASTTGTAVHVEKEDEASNTICTTNTSSMMAAMSIPSKIDYANMPSVSSIPLWELNCQFDMVTRRSTGLLADAVAQQRRSQRGNVTILFAVRQPG